jgi:hypothetical protein
MTTVCQKCAAGGLLIVQDLTGDVTQCVECERFPASKCSACVTRALAKPKGHGTYANVP